MDNSTRSSHDGNDWPFNPRLPVIIPPPHHPPAAAFRLRFASFLPRARLILVAAVASITGVLAATLWPLMHDRPSPVLTALLPGHGHARDNLVRDDAPNAGNGAEPAADTTGVAVRFLPGIGNDVCHIKLPAPQLVMSTPPTVLHADEPAALALTVDGAADGAQLVICGFAAKSVFSAGRPIDRETWVLPASDIADATLIPPPGFVGPMKLGVLLVNTDKSLADRSTLQFKWLPQPPGVSSGPDAPRSSVIPRQADAPGVNRLIEEAIRLKAAGKVAEARLILTRVAQAGDSRAAFMLAESYDPIALVKRQLLPADSDPEQARIWYRKASALGSTEAASRLERLTNW